MNSGFFYFCKRLGALKKNKTQTGSGLGWTNSK